MNGLLLTGKRLLRKPQQVVVIGGVTLVNCYVTYSLSETAIRRYVNKTEIEKSEEFVELKQLCASVLQKSSIQKELKDNVNFYITEELDMLQAGYLNKFVQYFSTPVYIGVPASFDKSYLDKLKVQNIKIDGKALELECYAENAATLKKSMNLSTEAKQFCIAQQILMCEKSNIPLQYALIMSYYLLSSGFLQYKFKAKNTAVRSCIFTMYYVVMLLAHTSLYAAINTAWASEADKVVSSMGLRYHKGGLEFFDKVIARNQFLQKLVANGDTSYMQEDNAKDLDTGNIYTKRRDAFRKLKCENI